MTATAVGLSVATAVAVMAWQAREDHGLVVEAFSVPPDLAQRGLTGQVAATHVLDRLSELQAATLTDRPASTYANAWDNDVKVEIPETGVSIGDLNRYLHQWLGHETRVSGEIVRTNVGLAVTARAGEAAARTVEGSEANLNALVQQAAEAVYAQTQPYRWAVYMQSHGRSDEALAAYADMAENGAGEDRQWAYNGWASLLNERGDVQAAADKAYESLRLFGPNGGAYENLESIEYTLEHTQAAFDDVRARLRFTSDPATAINSTGLLSALLGDYRSAAAIYSQGHRMAFLEGQSTFDTQLLRMRAEALDHDISLARRLDRPATSQRMIEYRIMTVAAVDMGLDDWAGAVHDLEAAQATLDPKVPRQAISLERTLWPRLALAYAMTGRGAEADALIAKTPLDCDVCVLMRGRIAAARRDWTAAARWCDLLARRTPSIPLANAAWGEALLAKGDLDGAIGKLAAAHRQSPTFADPQEIWGEALMSKGDFAGAAAKFAEADRDAPRWGRNHLRWGEALLRTGRHAAARAQFEMAGGLDLSRPDRAALNVFLDRTASGPLHG